MSAAPDLRRSQPTTARAGRIWKHWIAMRLCVSFFAIMYPRGVRHLVAFAADGCCFRVLIKPPGAPTTSRVDDAGSEVTHFPGARFSLRMSHPATIDNATDQGAPPNRVEAVEAA